MIIVPITTSMESPVVRAYDVKECRRLYIKSWKMKKKQREPTNKTLWVMFNYLQNQWGDKMVCVACKRNYSL